MRGAILVSLASASECVRRYSSIALSRSGGHLIGQSLIAARGVSTSASVAAAAAVAASAMAAAADAVAAPDAVPGAGDDDLHVARASKSKTARDTPLKVACRAPMCRYESFDSVSLRSTSLRTNGGTTGSDSIC